MRPSRHPSWKVDTVRVISMTVVKRLVFSIWSDFCFCVTHYFFSAFTMTWCRAPRSECWPLALFQFNSLELIAEELTSLMDANGRGLKRARTVRTEYLQDVDDVQRWLSQAEVMVQDRSSEPKTIKEHIQVRQHRLLITHRRYTSIDYEHLTGRRPSSQGWILLSSSIENDFAIP